MKMTDFHLQSFLWTYDLQVACFSCAIKKNEITFEIRTVKHQCAGSVLLARQRGSGNAWKHISRRPEFPVPYKYEVCWFFKIGHGCQKHGNRCTFARSEEEAAVWNFQKARQLSYSTLAEMVKAIQVPVDQRAQLKQLGVAEKIRANFNGQFLEVCEDCLYSSPQQISLRGQMMVCNSCSKHAWKPVLVHFQTGEHGKAVFHEIRPLPASTTLQYYRYVINGEPCWHGHRRCWFAHSEVEMAVWVAEAKEGLKRPNLLRQPQRQVAPTQAQAPASPPAQTYYCKACCLKFSSKDSFMNHCSSLDHARMISEDRGTEWRHRPPPGNLTQGFELCSRPDTCEYGQNCVAAHSTEELQEWILRTRSAQKRMRAAQEQGLLSYQDLLLKEYRSSGNEVHIMSSCVPGVSVTCSEDLTMSSKEDHLEWKWTFHVESERPLVHVALLKHEQGAVFTLGDICPEGPCTYATGNTFCTSHMSCDVPVTFKSLSPGFYEQWVVFDFDMRPVLLQKLRVRVGQRSPTPPAETPEGSGPCGQSLERWHRGNRMIVPCLERTEAEESLLKEYKPPQLNLRYKPRAEGTEPLTRENYRDGMHSFLYREELAQEELLERLSLKVTVTLMDTSGKKQDRTRERSAEVPVPYALTPDTVNGYLLRTAVQSALLAPSHPTDNKVYEAVISWEASSENTIFLHLSKRCCSDLGLLKDTTREMEVQFQLNRLQFCEWHQAVDLLPDVGIVLPDVTACSVPVHSGTFSKLNAKQSAAMAYIIGDTDGVRPVAPLLIYGPFGTGKTYTLASAAMEIVRQPDTKVLICTHTNSSADIYLKDYFHTWVNAGNTVPLRIKSNKRGVAVSATNHITLRYCLLSEDGESFIFPDKKTLDSRRIVVTTTMTARRFQALKLPPGYFTHILIDEASQMLECAALMPLALAGEGTRVVLAGDHMQMGPKLFSEEEGRHSDHTLLNRLFHFYQGETHEVASRSRIIFNENYRSTREIVEFVSTHFYVGKSDAIKAKGDVPPHPQFHPLMFHHVRGSCHWDRITSSYFNCEEIDQVAEIVQSLLHNWPSQWGDPSQRTICVASEGKQQVDFIRQKLRSKKLGKITVENLLNIQGRQFRVVVMTTIQTRDSLLSLSSATLEFFNEPRVLNTAMTRAQSQVIVVGDAAALCYFGKCSKIWRSYIAQCIEKGSAFPQHLTMEHIDQEVKETARFNRTGEEDISDTESVDSDLSDIDDPILLELLDESKDIRVTVTSEGLLDIVQNNYFTGSGEYQRPEEEPPFDYTESSLETLLRDNPSEYKHCELVLERYDSGYAWPLDQPTLHIKIQGKKNIGRAFPGDQVIVKIISNENSLPSGKVVGVLKVADHSRVFVCTIEHYDKQVMTPINICIPKIYTPFFQKKPNVIAVRKYENGMWIKTKCIKINEESKMNNLFVVQVLKWRNNFIYPLGVVKEVLPRVTSLEGGLKVLDIEYQLTRNPPSVQDELAKFEDLRLDGKNRKDYREYTTFTVDPKNSEDLDDAISVRDLGKWFEIGVHIADVASFVTKDCPIDKDARRRGMTYYSPGKEPVYMFPRSLSIKDFSLLPNSNRHTISLMVTVDKKTERIVESSFTFSVIRSDRKISYEEAEEIIQKYSGNEYRFNTVEDCLAVAYRFSRVHRKNRLLGDWYYESLDEDVNPGERRSHEMIKELMIMFNCTVAEFLISNTVTAKVTPIRCQNTPHPEQVYEFQSKYTSFIPLSIHLSYHFKVNKRLASENRPTMNQESNPTHQTVGRIVMTESEKSISQHSSSAVADDMCCILTSLWTELKSAVRNRDLDKIIDLIATDDIHPWLLPVLLEFRKLLSKAYIIRSNSTYHSKVGHYIMQLDSYTWASSPIRRYMDVIIQRHLHAVLRNTAAQYTVKEIDLFCAEFPQKHEKQVSYSKIVQSLNLASKLKSQTIQKVAFVVEVFPTGNSFKVSFPLNHSSLPHLHSVSYRDLQLASQPMYDDQSQCMILVWSQRVYSMQNSKIHSEIQQQRPNTYLTPVLTDTWQQIVSALRTGDWERVLSLFENINSGVNKVNCNHTETPGRELRVMPNFAQFPENTEKHYAELSLKLKTGGILQVQLGTDTKRGMLVPQIQLLIIHPKFEVCLEHARNPIECFSEYAIRASKQQYVDYLEYQRVWKPLCEMESAFNAVAENDSIVFEDTAVQWKMKSKSDKLEGFFQLTLAHKKLWCVECDLRKCFLCIRVRDQSRNSRENQFGLESSGHAPLSDQVDPKFFTWVAHGVTTKITDEEESKKLSYIQIDFYINHVPMKNIPDSIFQKGTAFTVELIPKLLPDVRKEDAVSNLARANELVKNIILGKKTLPHGAGVVRLRHQHFLIEGFGSLGLPHLNESQNIAKRKALENPFTLIQGPPGTGKTVVGVHIVYWFFQQNKDRRTPRKTKETEGTPVKKDCILYCGPSNKSVDVVAEYLLKFQSMLRPLRVYSDQMEMLEFPYPGSTLKLSRKSLREEKPKESLRSISLHHLIRMPGKPYADQILRFDVRIRSGDNLTDEEVDTHKKILNAARQQELENHDVILCTCTAASNPNFTQKLNPRQILIDECAMATEPEALIPLVAHKPEKIVLLGDHMQLRPIVHSELLKRLGMKKSLFERYMDKALMLDTQYRMHEDICEFPSKEFYHGLLKTGTKRKGSVLLAGRRATSILFGHVEGKEMSLIVSTEQGNENSKANMEEAEQCVRIARLLTKHSRIQPDHIAILTPYNAQISKINELLKKSEIYNVTVSTIMKSQGSEWRYVILSTVRSCPSSELETEPTKAWLTKTLGFVIDPNQVNVGITRAQEGFCVIGNKDLLTCSALWKRLIDHYQQKNCVMDANDIRVQNTSAH
nr:PREDICTED: helicase with zinc finger domain 2 [Lepisosteus oculatus]XP_015220184.1 PREDICTED: helicase with zinc finger domain 2 [Lepisosteus oculatus]XP_015220185.1 PREDICTED: helicase with zinc finger domain 2 [Lepisosteus oculatus]